MRPSINRPRAAALALAAATVVLSAVVANAQRATGDDGSIQKLETRRVQILKRAFINPLVSDRNSLEFRELRVATLFNICGLVKYRDRYGRYTPFVPFYVTPDGKLELLDPSLIAVESTRLKIKRACQGY